MIIVSDHGQFAPAHQRIWFRLNSLLVALGALEFSDAASGTIDFARIRAYSAIESRWGPSMGVNINVEGREWGGIISPDEANGLISELVEELPTVKFEDGPSIFGLVYASSNKVNGHQSSEPDIVVTHSQFTRSSDLGAQPILVGGRTFQLSDFLNWDPGLSGTHDRQGIVFIHGKGVKQGCIGQRVVSTSLQEILWRLTDKVDTVDPLLPWMRKVGRVERATTLDLAPTVLYALGLPVAEDIAGRPLSDVVVTGREAQWVPSYEGERHTPRAAQPAHPTKSYWNSSRHWVTSNSDCRRSIRA